MTVGIPLPSVLRRPLLDTLFRPLKNFRLIHLYGLKAISELLDNGVPDLFLLAELAESDVARNALVTMPEIPNSLIDVQSLYTGLSKDEV